MKKILWFDCETGGVDPKTDALIQLSALIEIKGEVVDQINLKMKALPGKVITPEAIAKHGMTLEDIEAFEDPYVAFKNFYKFLSKHDVKSKANRYIMAGYNSKFDCDFVFQWFLDITGETYAFWDYLQFKPIDIMPIIIGLHYAGIINTANDKLETICNHFEIPINAHDALSDITATRELTKKVLRKLWSGYTGELWDILGPVNAAKGVIQNELAI
jgi:DNA polymerase III epsilon subunit-like protein